MARREKLGLLMRPIILWAPAGACDEAK